MSKNDKTDKPFGYVLRPSGQSDRYIRRNELGWHDRAAIISNATVVKLHSTATRLSVQLAADAIPVYGDPRRAGNYALVPKKVWRVVTENCGVFKVTAHTVRWHKNWKPAGGLVPVFADGELIKEIPLNARVTCVAPDEA